MPAPRTYKHKVIPDFARRFDRFIASSAQDRKKVISGNESATQVIAAMCDEGKGLFEDFCDKTDYVSFLVHYTPRKDVPSTAHGSCKLCKDAFEQLLGILFP